MDRSSKIDTSNRLIKIPNKLMTDDGRELRIVSWGTSSVRGGLDRVYVEAIPVEKK